MKKKGKKERFVSTLIYVITIIFGIMVIITNGLTTSATIAVAALLIACFVVDNSNGE